MKRVVVLPEADAEMTAAFYVYRDIDAALGEKFRASVKTAFEYIGDFPLANAVFVQSVRRCRVRRFPFARLYVVRERNGDDEIVVITCVHTHSDPKSWRTQI